MKTAKDILLLYLSVKRLSLTSGSNLFTLPIGRTEILTDRPFQGVTNRLNRAPPKTQYILFLCGPVTSTPRTVVEHLCAEYYTR